MKIIMPSKLVEIKCPFCKYIFNRRESDIKNAISNTGYWACKTCTLIKRNKDKALPLYSKRLHKSSGYIDIKTEKGWMREHRYIAEQQLNINLTIDYDVHHEDNIKQNNNPNNLKIIKHADHTILHSTGRKKDNKCFSNVG